MKVKTYCFTFLLMVWFIPLLSEIEQPCSVHYLWDDCKNIFAHKKSDIDTTPYHLPSGFVYVTDIIPDATLEIRYYTTNNFVGQRIDSYCAPVAILSEPAAIALKKVQDDLKTQGYRIKIYDAYRPQAAVQHFMRWSKNPADTLMKSVFYPKVNKSQLYAQNYLSHRSGHSRGSTVDLTLVDNSTGKELDMGSPFDFFGNISHHDTPLINKEQKQNRDILRKTMIKYGFRIHQPEWWHYTLRYEPFPQTYFDFEVR